MPRGKRAGPLLGRRAPVPIILHSAPLVLPITTEPIRDGGVAVRGDRVLQVGPRAELLAYFPISEERRWPGMIVAGLVDACSGPGAPAPGVTARAEIVTAPAGQHALAGVSYVEVACASEEEWERTGRDAVITAMRELDRPVGVAPRTPDPQVLEDVAVLARTFGLRLLADLGYHSPAALDEAGALGPHCHVARARPLDPGERKLLRLRGTPVTICPAPGEALDDVPALLDEGDRVAFGTGPAPSGPGLLEQARAVRERVRATGARTRGLDRRLVEALTLGGAGALGMDGGVGRIGSLGPGGRADFAVFDARGRYPYSALLTCPPCLATVTGGRTGPRRP
ncbi:MULTISPECIES: amidohydrolase family protein [unclassified Nonomuraea]|uniref:amidohydrolase family protein n=1 Tax=unclassified Nonomuraea TaxID=2593643 RepID=UPI0033FB5229